MQRLSAAYNKRTSNLPLDLTPRRKRAMASPTLTTTPNTARRMQNVSRCPRAAENPSRAVAPGPPPAPPGPTPLPALPPGPSGQARGDRGSEMHRYGHGRDTGTGTASASPSGWLGSSICHGHGSTTLMLLAPSRKERRVLCVRRPLCQLPVLHSASREILQLSKPSSAPLCQPGSLSAQGGATFPSTTRKAVEPRGELWLGSPVRAQRAGGSQGLGCTPYLGGITTMGCPRLGLHMSTWASLALGFTSALGGMGSILLRIRGCSC